MQNRPHLSPVPVGPNRPSEQKDICRLNQEDLARRWKLSGRSLERWRWYKIGPRYLKIGGRVVYRLEDIEAYEAEHLHQTGS